MSSELIVEPRPTVQQIRRSLETELTTRSRAAYTMLLLFDLAMGAVIASLLITERGLPLRTQIAFGVLLVIAIAWAVFFAQTLSRTKLFLAGHRVVAARLAMAFTALFTLGACILGFAAADVRPTALAAAGSGAVMFAVAVVLFVRANRRLRTLMSRKESLERQIGARSDALRIWPVLIVLAMLLPAGGAASAQMVSANPFEAVVPVAPVPVRALGREHLVYELHVTNFGQKENRLLSLEVSDGSGVRLARWDAGELANRAVTIGLPVATRRDSLILGPGQRIVFYLWLTLPTGFERPGTLEHRLFTAGREEASPDALAIPTVTIAEFPQSLRSAPIPPGHWVSIRGPSNSSGHRRSLVPLDGRVRVPQRFAVDWAKLGDDGRLFRNEGRENSDWYGYDVPALAALPGRVLSVVDGVEENSPFSAPPEERVNRESAPGNAVIIDAGDGRYAVYAHLRPGSIRVKPGDMVAVSDELGRIGNSGHSLAPHLHFHIGDEPDVLASEGVPFVMPRFRLIGRLDSLAGLLGGDAWRAREDRPTRQVSGEIPLENMVIDIE